MTFDKFAETMGQALRTLVAKCPRLARECFWAGSAAMAIEELRHRQSLDLDFHTLRPHQDVRPLYEDICRAFPKSFRAPCPPDEDGYGFHGELRLPGKPMITIDLLALFDKLAKMDTVPSKTAPPMRRVSRTRYLGDKVQCVADRVEARDLLDIQTVLERYPELRTFARWRVVNLDAEILHERLAAWTDASLRRALAAYPAGSLAAAKAARSLLLRWMSGPD